MRKAKIYTGRGDGGFTSLADGARVLKSDLRVETYGGIDELNSIVAVLRSQMAQLAPKLSRVDFWLAAVQNDLLQIGAELANPKIKSNSTIAISEQELRSLEAMIDCLDAQLPPLRNFVIPGPTAANAYCHNARAVCRRCERQVVKLQQQQPVNPYLVSYLNRLSDFFFVLARWLVVKTKATELVWERNRGVGALDLKENQH